MTGQVITFYAYKGGTGRTMALANAAVLLARSGRGPVLAMDWDLEAPGLHRFFPGSAQPEPGTYLIDLLEELAGRARPSPGTSLSEPETFDVLRDIDLGRYGSETEHKGLHLMRAGRGEDETFAHRVSRFDWDGLYHDAPYLFPALARVLAERYRYVLVDSRTGLSDTSGVCTAALPEKLVVVFTPNQQSLDGALWRAHAAVHYRRRADDSRPLVVYPLASRVELSEDDLRREWRHGEGKGGERGYQPRFEQLFREIYGERSCDLTTWFDEIQLQHSARHAYGETIAVLDEAAIADRLSIARSYATFTEAIDKTESAWTLEASPAAPGAEDQRAQVVVHRVEQEIEWHRYRSGRRQALLMVRAYQAILLMAAVILVVVVEVNGADLAPWIPAAGAAGLGALLEAAASALGFSDWREHANLADVLTEELYRYRSGIGPYSSAANPIGLLAERTDEQLSFAYDQWPKSPLGVAPSPRPPTIGHRGIWLGAHEPHDREIAKQKR